MSRFLDDPAAVPGERDRVLVLGLGMSGEAAARHLLRLGTAVTVADQADDEAVRERARGLDRARAVFGAEVDEDIVNGCDLLVTSPGVPERAAVLVAAREAGVPIWSEVELAYRLARAPIIGVTGTNGKTTATGMLAAGLSGAGFRAAAAGNIGRPLVDAAVEDLQVIVAELSSFQLRHIVAFRAPVGVILNAAADHLDWHGSFDAYLASKARLFENQTEADVAVHLDDEPCGRAVAGTPARRVPFAVDRVPDGGAGVDDGWITVPEGRVVDATRSRTRGRPALANAVAAAAAACAYGAAPERVGDAIARFEPLAHRMELVAEIGGVTYINDSKATNPHAVLAALDGLERVILIAGGRNKGLDLRTLAAAPSVVHVVAIGQSAAEVEAAFAGALIVERAGSMDDAVARAAAVATRGDTVLLSPGCASFDMFADYKARGEAFRAAVKRLTSREGGPA